MSPSRICLRHDDPGRKMHQPRRILRLDRSAKPLHGYNGPLNPDHNHRATSDAPPTQDCRVYHPMSGWSVSTSRKTNHNSNAPHTHTHTHLTTPSNVQSDRHRRLAHHNSRPGILLPYPKPRCNVWNRILQLRNRSQCGRGNSLRSIPESHQQQVPPQTARQLAREIHLRCRHAFRNRRWVAQTPLECIQVDLACPAISVLHPRRGLRDGGPARGTAC